MTSLPLPRAAGISTAWLLRLAAISAALAIAAAPWALNRPWLNFAFKPLTTLLLIAWAWPRGRQHPARTALLAGLWLSLGGDVALMWPQQGFLPGLICFLLAHLAYMFGFTRGPGRCVWAPGLLLYGLVAAVVLSRLWPGVPTDLQLPVVVYVLALAGMAGLALGRWWHGRGDQAAAPWLRRAALGGALFMLSDAILATNKFRPPVPLDTLWVLASYWLAQACIAGSLPAPRRDR
ncbi:lysoplasmalogenase [Ideonella azotifigens]|uniref:Lysoplasmalogenase n=1 Tax=Ideonella azotifigens TaxID=513160 RepID=A0ABN1KAU3_9BURK|nr:lysoplasmalogenase [Ideonella azotifigens]MCD2338774.1 lysoplasmalogenase [Ideonella azotifigens]